jgi:hypothetical protein
MHGCTRGPRLLTVAAVAVLITTVTASPPFQPSTTQPFSYAEEPAQTPSWGPPRGGGLLALDPREGYVQSTSSSVTPDPRIAPDDKPAVFEQGCFADEERRDLLSCEYGEDDARLTVALVGDSSAAQWLPALEEIARNKDWKIRTYVKARCTLTTADIQARDSRRDTYDECEAWNKRLNDDLTEKRVPDVVITSASNQFLIKDGEPASARDRIKAWPQGLRNAWSRLSDAGIPVVAVVNTPTPGLPVPDCVEDSLGSLQSCATDRSSAISVQPEEIESAASGLSNVTVVDMNDLICPQATCPAVIGGILVYRDDRHITATYAKSLGKAFFERVTSGS